MAAINNPYQWATRAVPRSGLRPIPPREWNVLPPEPSGSTPALSKNVNFWAPNRNAKPVIGPNPLRRVYPRKEPEGWQEPKQKLPFDRKGQTASQAAEDDKNKTRFGWGVRCGAAPRSRRARAAAALSHALRCLCPSQRPRRAAGAGPQAARGGRKEPQGRSRRRQEAAAAKGRRQGGGGAAEDSPRWHEPQGPEGHDEGRRHAVSQGVLHRRRRRRRMRNRREWSRGGAKGGGAVRVRV